VKFPVLALALVLTPCAARAAAMCDAVPVLAADTREALRGVEDIVIDREAGVAYLSADDRLTVEEQIGGPAARTTQGGLYALALTKLDGPLVALPLTRDFAGKIDFHPHGIDLFVAPLGTRTLFAVNHRFLNENGRWRSEQAIEVFDVGGGGLTHRTSVIDPLIVTPNDVAATGEEAFYVTNDHGSEAGLGHAMEDVFGRGRGSVVAVDLALPPAQRVRVIARNIAFANGIAISPDRRFLHIAASRDKALLSYEIAQPDKAPRVIPLPLGPDNLSWAPDGRLAISGHPDLIRFALYAKTARWRWGVRTSPSMVIRLDPTASDPHASIEMLWHDDGTMLSGSTVAAVGDGIMLVGTVLSDRIAVCKL